MTASQWEIAGVIATVLLGMISLLRSVRRSAKADAERAKAAEEQDRRERAEIAGKAFADGAASRNDEVALLRSQRDDARRQRDETKLELREERTERRRLEDELRRRGPG